MDENVWITAVTIHYWRLVAIDHRKEWYSCYEKADEWLRVQCKHDAVVLKEIHECARKLVIERYQVDQESLQVDRSFEQTEEKKVELKQKAKKKERQELKLAELTSEYLLSVLFVLSDIFMPVLFILACYSR